jgi:hypothetical protein
VAFTAIRKESFLKALSTTPERDETAAKDKNTNNQIKTAIIFLPPDSVESRFSDIYY